MGKIKNEFDYSKVRQSNRFFGENPLSKEEWESLYKDCIKINENGIGSDLREKHIDELRLILKRLGHLGGFYWDNIMNDAYDEIDRYILKRFKESREIISNIAY